jgi:hypothetical protein
MQLRLNFLAGTKLLEIRTALEIIGVQICVFTVGEADIDFFKCFSDGTYTLVEIKELIVLTCERQLLTQSITLAPVFITILIVNPPPRERIESSKRCFIMSFTKQNLIVTLTSYNCFVLGRSNHHH